MMLARLHRQAPLAALACFAAAGCDAIWGVHKATLYVPDAGTTTTTATGGAGGTGGAAGGGGTSTGGSGGCAPGTTIPCYDGPDGTEGIGICQSGSKTCMPDGTGYGACVGAVLPQAETCAGPADEDCSGHDCVQWAQLLGGIQSQTASRVAVDTQGNVVVAGSFSGAIPLGIKTLTAKGSADVFVIKFSPSGQPLWGTSYGEIGAFLAPLTGLALDGTGDVIVYGATSNSVIIGTAAIAGPAIYVAKLGAGDGGVLWSKGFTSSSSSVLPKALAVTPEGHIFIGGSFNFANIDFEIAQLQNPNPYPNGFLVRLSGADGGAAWTKTLCSGGVNACWVKGLAIDTTGSLTVAVEFSGKASLGSGPDLTALGKQDAVVGQLAIDGTPIHQRQIGGSGADVSVTGLVAAPNAGVVLTGSFHGTVDLGGGPISSTNGAAFVAQFDEAAQGYAWSQTTEEASFTALGTDASKNVIVAGAQDPGGFEFCGTVFPGGSDIFVAKLSMSGSLSWAKLYDTGGGVADLAVTAAGVPIFVGSVGNASVDFGTGKLNSGGSGDGFVVKLSP